MGREKLTIAPHDLPDSAHMRPPCTSIMDRLIFSPIPIPPFFVVKKGSKIESVRSVQTVARIFNLDQNGIHIP
jgi:hypothetical protein